LIIPDLHCPYQHESAFDFLADLQRRYKPGKVLCIGDEIDAHCFGRWPANPDADGPGKELQAAVAALQPLYKLFPSVRVCRSNHTYRPWKQAAEAGLPSRLLKTERQVLQAPRGWQWADWWEADGALAIHGDGFNGLRPAWDAMQRHRRSVVMGHVHSAAGVLYSATRWETLWALSVGCLIDCDSIALRYGLHHPRRPVLGAGLIVDGVPQFVPLEV